MSRFGFIIFEHAHMLKLIGKEILTILCSKILFI